MIILFLLLTFSPILGEVITEWLHRMYEKSEAKRRLDWKFFGKSTKTVKEWGKCNGVHLASGNSKNPYKPRKNRGSFSA